MATMAYPGFGHLWQQADMSDVQIVLSIVEASAPAGDEASEAADAQSSNRTLLQQFHSVILSLCPYLVAQASATSLLSIDAYFKSSACVVEAGIPS